MVAQNYWEIRVCGGLNAVDINLRYLNDIFGSVSAIFNFFFVTRYSLQSYNRIFVSYTGFLNYCFL